MKKGVRKYKDGWAIFAIDPGGTTGVSEAYVPDRVTVAEALRDARIVASEIRGPYQMQAIEIAMKYRAFRLKAESFHIQPNRIVVPIESFQLRQRNVDLSPVRVQCALEGMLVNYPVKFVEQTPANAKAFATDDRLRKWGLYEHGSAHKRDANRHVALFVARSVVQ